jgi:hypothetical protein
MSWIWRFRVLATSAAGASILAASVLGAAEPTAAASANSVYWGAYISGAPFDTSLMDSFEARTGKKMSIVHWGEAWTRNGGYQGFQTFYMQSVRNRGGIPMLTWGSWDSSLGKTQPNFQLADITSGTYDGYITQWAKDARLWGQPFFLRFDNEMNGTWQFPWAEQINGNQPGDFVRAWKHVHDIFTQQGATNVTWVWCPNVSGGNTTPLNGLYPGDNYVDWTCMDGYNWGTDNNDAWQTFGQVFAGPAFGGYNLHNTYTELVNLAPSKPIMLGEVASSENGGSKAGWITDMLQTQLPTNFPLIRAVAWTNWNDDNPALSWPIESSTSSQNAFAVGIGSSYYTSNGFGALGGGPIQPPGGAPTPVTPTATPTSTSTATPTSTVTATPTATATATRVPPTSTPMPAITTTTFNPLADTYTSRSAPASTAGGNALTLRADIASYSDTSFLRFDLAPLAGKTITSATLRLHASTEAWAGSAATFDVNQVVANDWKEAWMSYTNSVPVSSTLLGSFVAPSSPNSWYASTLSPGAVQPRAGGLLSMALSARTGDVLIFNSREAGAVLAPQLIVTYR